MKVFEMKKRTNFVDENNVLIGWENDQHCCEMFGWFIKDEIMKVIPPYEKVNEELLKEYVFDKEFFLRIRDKSEFDEGGIVIFRLNATGKKPLYLHLYNMQNGYYSHGFKVQVGGEIIREDLL